MKVAVVDLDDTILTSGRASHFFWWLSLQFQRIGRRLQKANSALVTSLEEYDRVIVLTGRDAKESKFTQRQLIKAGVKINSLVCCPRKQIINEWKERTVSQLGDSDSIVWIDDIFKEAVLLKKVAAPNVIKMAPVSSGIAQAERTSELEWL